jgi:hypothetical protein
VRVPSPTPDRFRGLARSSPWRWRALALDLHRRPVHGPEHTVHALVERGVGLEVRLADGERHVVSELPFAWELPVEVDADGFVVRRPAQRADDDPVWPDAQWVAMLDPVELADGSVRGPRPGQDPDVAPPPALDVHRVEATLRHGRETWWAEVAPREEYTPRCSCCPLLFGRVSAELEALGGSPTGLDRQPDLTYATRYLVALDLGTGVCVHVEHLDGDHAGRGFSVEIRSVDAARS